MRDDMLQCGTWHATAYVLCVVCYMLYVVCVMGVVCCVLYVVYCMLCVVCCATSLLCMQLSSITPSGLIPFTAPRVIEVLQ